MSDIIRLLPDSVANQIAAGEVIQRPASVIKELVENAVDAGASSISIIIKDAGRTLIQVVDNGSGMSDTDARMAFERHATSKIKNADDLFALRTMGFRGEALASIAAIAQIDLRTMLRGASLGTRLLINGSKVESQEPEACVAGTNIMVKNLFFNVPARRKFLKKDSVEMSNIMREFERLALVNTEIEFTLIHNDVTVQQLRRGNLKQRIVELFGKGIDKQIIPINAEVSFVKLSGFVSLPEHARRRNSLQYFFVNGRNMRHPYFHKAVVSCYEHLIAPDVQPNYFINFEVDPATIDVNIHPTKHEIKFEDEKVIWQVLVAAIREALGKFNAVPGIDFDTEGSPEIPTFAPNVRGEHGIDIDPKYNPFTNERGHQSSKPGSMGRNDHHKLVQDWEKLYQNFSANGESQPGNTAGSEEFTVDSVLNQVSSEIDTMGDKFDAIPGIDTAMTTTGVLQIANRYILAPCSEGVMVIDRRRAHIRVLYERFLSLAREHRLSSQHILFPETITLSPADNVVLTSLCPTLTPLGFELSYQGNNKWSIYSAPAELGNVNVAESILSIIALAGETGNEPGDKLYEQLALSMARTAATNSHYNMSDIEAEQLLSDLFSLSTPTYTPDGMTIIATIPLEELSRRL
ncbi:MAG: DNA mismatch repair endonuclease MutL [Muribaculaceae bacterium]|nr:DNA mismatch repair endonuclease MutL [Muribaculaceae bacterium]